MIFIFIFFSFFRQEIEEDGYNAWRIYIYISWEKRRRKNEEIGLLKSVLLLPVELLELLSEDLFTTFTSKEVSAKYEKRSFYYYKFPNWKANNGFFREIVPQRF